ncbi:DUF456 domain-containing protein [Chromohalobacter israelensis]|uniref:DUF456 domain-containing protein n=1 Tax=Chromohalobacter israelensis TaxID=141390 RepID=UPI000FFEE700|nr:DUF456 domain-containing protein [Chromohalobacter salexigens]RXE48697.1 hypothetical protein B4O83_12255 [Chromohalobacter salexigens]
MARSYKTTFIIDGDSSGAVQAQRAVRNESQALTRELENAERQNEELSTSFESVSRHATQLTTFLGGAAAAIGTLATHQTLAIAEQQNLARTLDISVQTLQEWQFAANQVGVNSDKLGDIFKDTSDKLGDFVATGGGEAADLFEQLNINVDKLQNRGPAEQLLAIGRALDDVGSRSQKVFFLESIADDASRLLPLLENNGELLKENAELARQLGVSIPPNDVDSIKDAAAALKELKGVGTGFANEVATQAAPAIRELTDDVEDAINVLGGMGNAVDTMQVGVATLATLLSARLAGSLATATAATTRKIATDLAAAQQARATEAAEAGHAAALARTAAAEKTAAANSAALAAQRATSARQEAAAEAQRIQSLQASLAAERALEAQRLQAQITSKGRQQSINRMAELRRTEVATTNQVTAATTRLAEAETAEAAAARQARLAKVEQARATNAATAAEGRYTAATKAATAANRALAASGRALSGAMGLLGGPVGAAIVAAGAIYTFRDELGLTLPKLEASSEAVATLTGELDGMNQAAAELQLTNLIGKLADLKAQAEATGQAYLEVGQTEQQSGGGFLGVDVGGQVEQIQQISEASSGARQEVANVEAAIAAVRGRLKELKDQGERTTPTIKDLGAASDDAATAAEKFDDSLLSLLDRIDPLAKSQREFTRDNAALQTALLSGRITTEEYFESIAQLEQSYRNASSAAEVYGFTGTKAMDDVADAADPMATAIERSVERLDDSFVDFWENTLSGAENTFDSFKDLAISTLAEIIHAYTTRQITASLGASLSVDGSGGGATGQSGGLGDLSSIGSNVYQGVVDGFGSINWMGNPTSYSGGWAGSATAGMNSGGSFLSNGSMSNFSGMQGLAALPASMVGNYVGSNLGESLTGKQANSNIGATAGAAIGTFFGGPIGAFAGSTLGSFLDSAFGSSGPELDLALQRGDVASYETGDWDHGLRAQSALGTVGFNGTNSHDINATWGHDNAQKALDAIAQLDNVLASLADSPDQLGAMSSAVEGYYGESSSPQKALDALTSRYRQAIDTLDLTFEDTILGFEGSADELVTLASALDGVETSVGDNAQAIADARQALAGSDDLVATAQQLAAQGPALGALAAAADRLNLRFDETASGALAAAGGMAELVGGIDTLAGLQSQYYQAFFSDAEQLEHLQSDLEAQYAELGLTLPDTSAGFRDLVEAQNLMTEAGREQYAALLQLVPAMDQYLSAMDQQAAEVERQRQQISNWLDDLLLSDQSTLAPSERLQESQSQYAATLVRAEAGDADALGNLGSLAQQYLSEAAGYYGQGSSQYGTLFDEIIAAAQGLDGSHANGLASVPWDGYRAELHAGETVLPAPIAQLYRESAPGNNGNGAVVAELQALRRESQQLRDEVRQLRAERAKDADRAAGQRADQLREQQRINRNTKARPSTV